MAGKTKPWYQIFKTFELMVELSIQVFFFTPILCCKHSLLHGDEEVIIWQWCTSTPAPCWCYVGFRSLTTVGYRNCRTSIVVWWLPDLVFRQSVADLVICWNGSLQGHQLVVFTMETAILPTADWPYQCGRFVGYAITDFHSSGSGRTHLMMSA